MANIMLVDDEVNVREVLTLSLNSFGHEVVACSGFSQAKESLSKQTFDLVITDLRMDNADTGLDILRLVGKKQPKAKTLLLTAYASTETAVEAIKEGAFDYITKPISRTELGDVVERALSTKEPLPQQTSHATSTQIQHGHLIGKSELMQHVRERLKRASTRDFTVLITGESGTGKELAARMVHEMSSRSEHPFVPVHCGAIPENLFESELFGYIKGAFTGAEHDKVGLIESADKGTLFLDEIGEMPLHAQVKLLRVLQDMHVRPVGSSQEKQVNIRVLAATNRNLEEEVKKGSFREDLFYRLNVIPIHMPPLRQRREDIPDLVQEIMRKLGAINVGVSQRCLEKISALPLAGNVRELENTLQRLLALSDAELDIDLLEEFHTSQPSGISLDSMQQQEMNLDEQLEYIEKKLIQQALSKTKNNATKAAKLLGIGFRSIRYRLEKLGIKDLSND